VQPPHDYFSPVACMPACMHRAINEINKSLAKVCWQNTIVSISEVKSSRDIRDVCNLLQCDPIFLFLVYDVDRDVSFDTGK
jgi:hypothetical protein